MLRLVKFITLALWLVTAARSVQGGCDVVDLAAGSRHALALRADGTVWAWGDNRHGQAGDGALAGPGGFPYREEPVQVLAAVSGGGSASLTDVVAVAAGGYHSLALRADGTVWAWGSNMYGQLGYDPDQILYSAVAIQVQDPNSPGTPLSGIRAIAAGSHHSLAILSDGQLVAWGWNHAGQLGLDPALVSGSWQPVAVALPGAVEPMAVAAGHAHSLALLADGTVLSWGYNGSGQLGRILTGGLRFTHQADQVAGLAGVKLLRAAMGGNYSAALLSDGTLAGWGSNDFGQLGGAAGLDVPLPVALPLPAGAAYPRDVSAGTKHLLMLLDSGQVWGLGFKRFGQTGVNATGGDFTEMPERVDASVLAQPVSLIAAGGLHSVVFEAGLVVRTFGLDDRGQLGDGAGRSDGPSPVVSRPES